MITVSNLTKKYGSFTAVDDITFTVQPGKVTGFLGPNGAGKSTAMRMMVGLTPPTSGSATILGTAYGLLPNPGRRVGVLLDAGAQHDGRAGREVLALSARTMGLPESRVDEVMGLVGLTASEGKRRVGAYSLGMRQRLGIAGALLGDPEVLILDEPVNGLDPAGIRWMRELLKAFATRGGTVLLSSHLLHEVEIIADELIVIGRGRIVAQGSKAELMAAEGTSVRSTDDVAFAQALTAAGLEVRTTDSGLLVRADTLAVGTLAARHGIVLTELGAAGSAGLEDLFLQLTADDAREEVAA